MEPERTSSATPTRASELTPEWLSEILRAAGVLPSGRVISLDTAALSDNSGLMSQIVRVRPVYDEPRLSAPASLIAKFPPADADLRRLGIELGFFEGESRFYEELADQAVIRTPRCYFTRFDAHTGAFFTLLEDCSTSARRGDVTAGCSKDEVLAAVELLARFHASWWNSPALSDHPWVRRRSDELAAGLIPNAWDGFSERFGAILDPEDMALLARAPEVLAGSIDALVGPPVTLLHADYKLDNLFFAASGEITVIDWGLVAIGPPMFDVASFLALNLPSHERRDWEHNLIGEYVHVLRRDGAVDYDFERALLDYRFQLFALVPQLINAGGLARFADAQALGLYAEGLRRVVTALRENKSIERLQS